MAETISWRSVELTEDLPRMLVKTCFDRNGYEIQLTDLSRIWGERLRKKEIVDRANESGCSIDPSDDDQYDILLDKIGSALRGDKGTTLELHALRDGHAFQLDVSAPLPGSLPTFKWSIDLTRMPDPTVGTELVTPLLSQASQLRHQMQLLIDELAAKDRVIAKITDRLETSGNDLTAVFPGVSNIKTSRRKSQRAQLASYIKGLADFEEDAWRASLKQNAEPVDLPSHILNNVLEGLPISEIPARTLATGDWWTDLPNAGSKRHRSQNSNAASHASQKGGKISNGQPNGVPLTTEDSMMDDEFQRQGTPPQLKKTAPAIESPKPAATGPIEDEETEDEDDLDAAPSHPSSSQTKGRSQQQQSNDSSSAPRKLGAFGGSKSKSPQPSPQAAQEPEQDAETEEEEEDPAPKPKPKGKLDAFGGKKKSATPEPAPEPEAVPHAEPASAEQSAPKPKSRLGAFGGKSKGAVSSSTPSDTEQPESNAKTKPKSKLDTFGGKGKTSTDSAPVKVEVEEGAPSAPAKGRFGRMGGKGGSKETEAVRNEPEPEVERQSRAPQKAAEPEEQVREDSQERADKKRERLKRELEEKSKGPVKKKRRF